MRLYDYFRSSAAYRVRIALNLKGLPHDREEVHLLRDGGAQLAPSFRAINPQGRVPVLVLADGTTLTQSPAILEWLEEAYPEPPLLPRDALARARVRAVAALVGCDIHPINNLSVLRYLKRDMHQAQEAIDAWYRHWIAEGFRAIERMIDGVPFCFGEQPGLADVYLVPQVYNARRYGMDLGDFPRIAAADAACAAIPAFADARPEAVAPET